jgi:hypothetical protein
MPGRKVLFFSAGSKYSSELGEVSDAQQCARLFQVFSATMLRGPFLAKLSLDSVGC